MTLVSPTADTKSTALFVTVPLAIVMVLLVGVLITRKSAADRADYDPLTGKPAPENSLTATGWKRVRSSTAR